MVHPTQMKFEKDMIRPLTREEALTYIHNNLDFEGALGFTTLRIFPEFTGMKISKVILQYLLSMSPRLIRIYGTREGVKMDGDTGRITIFLGRDERIDYIEYGIELKLPPINHNVILCDGHIMDCLLEDQKRGE